MSDAGEFKMEAYRISAHRVGDGLLMEQYLVQASDERDAHRQCQLRRTVGEVEWAVEKLTATPSPCSCDESLDLRARLREAAGHIGELLAPIPETANAFQAAVNKAANREAARSWLRVYLGRGGA